MNKKVIEITPNGIKQALDDLLEENKYLQQELNKKNNIIEEIKEYCKKEQARIVINNTNEDEFIYTELLIKIEELEKGSEE